MPQRDGTRFLTQCRRPAGIGGATWLALCLAVTTVFSSIPAVASHERPVRYVLILNSYRRDTRYTEYQESAIRRVLRRDDELRVVVLYEYMGANTEAEKESLRLLAPVLRNRLAGRRLDLVVTTDYLAFQFAQDYRDSLFSDVPIVFSALPAARWHDTKRRTGVTGVVEDVDFGATLDVIRRLQPKARRLFVVSDDSGHGTALRRLTEAALQSRADPFEVRWLESLDREGLIERVVELPADSAVLYLADYHLNTLSCDSMNCDLCEVARASPVPVYTVYDVYLAHDLLGGHVTSGELQGQIAGEIGLRVLHGEPIASIPVVTGMSNRPMFNWRAMQRWGIDESRLPPGSLVRLRELGFFERYRNYLITFAVVFGGQTLILVAAFLASRARGRREAAARKASDRRLELVLEATSEGVWDWNVQTGEVYFSESWARSLGYEPRDVPKVVQFWESIVHPDDWHRVRDALDAHLRGNTPVYECENRLRMASGEYRWNLDRGRVVEWDAKGRPLRMVGTDRDITNFKRTHEALLATSTELDAVTGLQFLRNLVCHIAGTLKTEFAFVGEIRDDDLQHVHTLAAHAPGTTIDEITYGTEDTPCELVLRNGVGIFAAGVQDRFPRDAFLRRIGAESYAGIRLRDSSGRLIGIFCVVGRGPVHDAPSVESLLRIVAVRASAELERLRIDRALCASRESLRASNELLAAVADIQSQLLDDTDPRALYRNLLTTLLSLTKSEYGFIGEILRDDAGKPYLSTHAITDISWNDDTRRLYRENERKGFKFYNLETLFGRVITAGGPVIANDPSHDPRSGGLPSGHPPLHAFLGLPFSHAGRIVGMIGLANRPRGYDESVIAYLTPLTAACGSVMATHRTERRRREAEAALRHARDELESRVRERTAELNRANAGLEAELSRRRQAETALRSSEERFHQLADATFEGIALLEQGRITAANQALANMFGIPRERLIGMLRMELIAPAARPAACEAMREDDPHDPSHRHESIGLRADGSEFPIEMRARRLHFAGRTVHVTAIQDISHRRAAQEREARHRAELAHVLRRNTLGELASGLAHELNQPLAAISNYARACQRRIASGHLPAGEIAKALSEMGGQCDRAGMIIRRMRNFVRKGEPQTAPCDLNDVVRSAVRFIESEAAIDGIIVSTDLGPDLPPIEADPVQLEQVVLNLLRNACDAAKSNHAAEKTVAISTSHAGGAVRVSVIDTGPGLAPRIRERLFDAFQTTKAQGLGLGLSISRSIIEAHGGRIWYEPREASGAAFHFALRCGKPSIHKRATSKGD